MYTIHARNVNDALSQGMMLLRQHGKRRVSRGIEVIEYPGPVATTYQRPMERVLFDPVRDANPFFHFLESAWILAGREDVAFVAHVLPRMAEFADEDSSVFHGAYGYRLRHAPCASPNDSDDYDQIDRVIGLLQAKPDTRQAVLQIWNHQRDLDASTKDVPCNNLLFLKVRDDALHITVCCRSNDIVWGAYGANAVQFSMLQEYIAARLDLAVGTYTQVSDSYHAYPTVPYWTDAPIGYAHDPYDAGTVQPMALFDDATELELDLHHMFRAWDNTRKLGPPGHYVTVFARTAAWMFHALSMHRNGNTANALRIVNDEIEPPDWREACVQWLTRRNNAAR